MSWEGYFNINGKQYLIAMLGFQEPGMEMGKQWEVKFELEQEGRWTQDITGTGDAGPVFSTVLSGIREWMSAAKPTSFMMTARESNRKSLYMRMTKLLPGNWEVEDLGTTIYVYDSSAAQPEFSGFGDDDFSDYYDDDEYY